jgi:hypothetical protein
MTLLRRLAGVSLLAALGHVIFGGFVRISGMRRSLAQVLRLLVPAI